MPSIVIPRADPFASLNDEQRAAVEHGIGEAGGGPLLVIAGAGTGKTMTLAARVARLVLAGADDPTPRVSAFFADNLRASRVLLLAGPHHGVNAPLRLERRQLMTELARDRIRAAIVEGEHKLGEQVSEAQRA